MGATPVNKNWDGSVNKNTQPAVLKRISMSEVEIVADETPSEMIVDIENQIAGLESEVSDLHVAVESVNIAPKISEAYTVSSVAPGYGGVEKLFDGIKEKVDPLTKKRLGRSDSFATATTAFPFIAVDLGFRTEISHVRITNNFGGIPDDRGDCSHTDENGNVVKDNWCYHYREGIAWTNVYLSNIAPSECETVAGAPDCAKVWSKDSVVSEESFWCGVVGNDQEDTLYDSWDQDCASSLAKFGAPGVKYQYVYFVKNTQSTPETTLYRGAWERFTGGANPQTNCDATCAANLAAAADDNTTSRASVLVAIAEPTSQNYATTRNEKALAISEIEIIAKETVSELLADLRMPVDEGSVLRKYVNDACLQNIEGMDSNTNSGWGDQKLWSKEELNAFVLPACVSESAPASATDGTTVAANNRARRNAACPAYPSAAASSAEASGGAIAGIVVAVLVVAVIVAVVVVRSKNGGAEKSTAKAKQNNISFENPMYSANSGAANSDQKENPLYDDADMDEHDDLYDEFDASKEAGESKYDEFEDGETGDIYDDNVLDEEDADDAGYLDVDAGEDAGYLDVDEGDEDGGIYDDF